MPAAEDLTGLQSVGTLVPCTWGSVSFLGLLSGVAVGGGSPVCVTSVAPASGGGWLPAAPWVGSSDRVARSSITSCTGCVVASPPSECGSDGVTAAATELAAGGWREKPGAGGGVTIVGSDVVLLFRLS